MVVLKMRRGFPLQLAPVQIPRVTADDVERYMLVLNPLYHVVEATCNEMSAAVRALTVENEEGHLDRLFIDHLKKERVLYGRGRHGKFSMRFHRLKRRPHIRLTLSLGSEPFLQQVNIEPVFIFWNLKEYPIHVFCEWPLDETSGVDLTDLSVYAESPHQSINSHAFVRPIQTYPHVGQMCTEDTLVRILMLHRGADDFDPATCLLEQLRAAARILKYGLRQRDRHISQYHPFHKVPDEQYQAVIRGWERANRLAKKHGAEIVRYVR
jgi:hypothetical protein